jgi:hypothetical protein
MFHVPQCHGTAWTPLLLSMEQVSKLHRAVASPPPAPSRRFVKRGEGLADIYEADLTLAPNLNVSWLWRVDHRPISVWLACPTDFGTSFFCYPEHLPGLLDALQRTLDPVVPREAS